MRILDSIDELVAENPPEETKSRFGNKTMKLSARLSTILLAATALLTVMATGA